VVVFSPEAEVADGCDGMVVFGSGHVPTFGRVFFEDERVRLQPLNLEFSPIVVSRKRVRAVYRAVWRFQKLG
jgi:SOS-response transcriptional repressor LexA